MEGTTPQQGQCCTPTLFEFFALLLEGRTNAGWRYECWSGWAEPLHVNYTNLVKSGPHTARLFDNLAMCQGSNSANKLHVNFA